MKIPCYWFLQFVRSANIQHFLYKKKKNMKHYSIVVVDEGWRGAIQVSWVAIAGEASFSTCHLHSSFVDFWNFRSKCFSTTDIVDEHFRFANLDELTYSLRFVDLDKLRSRCGSSSCLHSDLEGVEVVAHLNLNLKWCNFQ